MSRLDDKLLVDDSAFSNDYMNSLSPVRRDILEDCMTILGYPVITLFITQRMMNHLIDMAVRKCENKVCQSFLCEMYVGNKGCLDVSKYNMEAVMHIYSSDIGAKGTDSNKLTADPDDEGTCTNPLSACDICDKLCRYRMFSYNGLTDSSGRTRLFDWMSYQYAYSEMKNLMLDDYYLDIAEQKLYVDDYTGWCTIEYVKSNCTIEDLAKNTQWRAWVRDYTLALIKITEGRIRSKYKISSGVFEIESDELISEGTSEKDNLEEKLNDDMGYWNIMRG